MSPSAQCRVIDGAIDCQLGAYYRFRHRGPIGAVDACVEADGQWYWLVSAEEALCVDVKGVKIWAKLTGDLWEGNFMGCRWSSVVFDRVGTEFIERPGFAPGLWVYYKLDNGVEMDPFFVTDRDAQEVILRMAQMCLKPGIRPAEAPCAEVPA